MAQSAEDLHVKVDFAEGESKKTLVIRYDDPKKVYDKQKLTLSGTITTPSEFYQKRKENINPKKGHVTFSKNKRQIVLTVNAESHFKQVITGELKKHAFLNSLHINDNVPYSIPGLRQTLKQKGMYFKDKQAYKALVLSLQNYNATVEKTISEWKETEGQKKTGVKIEKRLSETTTGMKFDFTLNLAIFEGGKKVDVPITVVIEPGDGQVELFLEYDDLDEKIEKEIEEIFESQMEIFNEFALIELD